MEYKKIVPVVECRVGMVQNGHIKALSRMVTCVLILEVPNRGRVEVNVKDLMSCRRTMAGLSDWQHLQVCVPQEVFVVTIPETGRIKVRPECLNQWIDKAFPPKSGYRRNRKEPTIKKKRGYIKTR